MATADPDTTLAQFEALLTGPGTELLERLAAERVEEKDALRLGEELRRHYPTDLVVAALTQHELRLRAVDKFAMAMRMFFTRAGLEQASSETVAGYRARRFRGARTVADLCTGIGGDLIALATGRAAVAVDRDPLHLRIARANAEVTGVADSVTALAGDVRDVPLPGVDGAFVDPARRDGGRRMRPGESEPPLDWCAALAQRVDAVGVKAGPALPHEAVPAGWEVEFVALGNELKEAVLWSPRLRTTSRRATVLPGEHTLQPEPGPRVAVRPPGAYLLDPNPAVTRAGLVEDLARRLGAWKIDDRIAFLSADQPPSTPFGRTLRVLESAPWDEKRLPARLRALDVGSVDIRRRGLAGDVGRLRSRLKLTGSLRATVVMTRSGGRPWCLVCVDQQ